MHFFVRWFVELVGGMVRRLAQSRAALAGAPPAVAPPVALGAAVYRHWASCRSCNAALRTVWRFADASYCQECHEEVSADSDSSSGTGAFSDR